VKKEGPGNEVDSLSKKFGDFTDLVRLKSGKFQSEISFRENTFLFKSTTRTICHLNCKRPGTQCNDRKCN